MRDQAGFTLVELLAALVAGGLLLALLGAMTGMFGAELHRAQKGDGFDGIAAAAPLLDRLLADAQPGPGGKGEAVDADAGHLTTYVAPPLSRRGTGLMRLDLDVARAADGEALDLTLAPADSADVAGMPARRRLVSGMKAIDITLDAADAPGKPPRLITIAFMTLANERWELAVEPRITASGGCRFDPISMTCRP